MKYEIGKTYTYEGEIKICKTGFHACRNLKDVFMHYPLEKQYRYFEITTPKIVDWVVDKVVCKEITFVRELTVQEIQDEVLKSNELYYVTIFARCIKGANIKLLQAKILESDNPYYTYLFARDVEGANIDLLQKRIAELSSSCYIYLFAKDVKGADIDLLQKRIVELGNSEHIYYFANEVENADIGLLKTRILELGDFVYVSLVKRGIIRTFN
jgi:hypothetical protein